MAANFREQFAEDRKREAVKRSEAESMADVGNVYCSCLTDTVFYGKGWCNNCGQKTLQLKEWSKNASCRNEVFYSWIAVCGCCAHEVKVNGARSFSWPNKCPVDANALTQIYNKIMAEAVGSFKDKEDAVAVRLREIACELKKEIERYSG